MKLRSSRPPVHAPCLQQLHVQSWKLAMATSSSFGLLDPSWGQSAKFALHASSVHCERPRTMKLYLDASSAPSRLHRHSQLVDTYASASWADAPPTRAMSTARLAATRTARDEVDIADERGSLSGRGRRAREVRLLRGSRRGRRRDPIRVVARASRRAFQ